MRSPLLSGGIGGLQRAWQASHANASIFDVLVLILSAYVRALERQRGQTRAEALNTHHAKRAVRSQIKADLPAA